MAVATKDSVLTKAVDLAREVAVDAAVTPSDVGEHLGVVVEGERIVSHRFACTAAGYRGWEWTVTLARVARGKVATVCEASLLPGDGALLAPAWVPWADRLRPGDIGPGDVLPFRADDPRLEQGWTPSGDPEADEVAISELALARTRILSATGRSEAAERWFKAQGPTTPGALAAAAGCGSCGFLVPLQGSLGQVFAVCANEWSPDDGKVVTYDHGCGAHSQTDVVAPPSEWPAPSALVDEMELELVVGAGTRRDDTVAEPAVEAPGDAVTEPAGDVVAEPAAEMPGDAVTDPAGDVAAEPAAPADDAGSPQVAD